MKKFCQILSIFLATSLPVLNILACDNDTKNIKPMMSPSWVAKMIEKNPTSATIGYDHYFLPNKISDGDSFNQHDWINLDSKSGMYIYLPDVDNIKSAISALALKDSAQTMNLPNPINWKQVNNTTYTNNNFITEDTSVGNNSLMDNEKFKQILTSNKSKTWTNKEMNNFQKYGSMPATTSKTDQNWWNANGWEKLLNDTPSFHKNNKNYSQLDIYQQWISQAIIGMNVPLSLVDENSFTLQTTNLNHVFYLITIPKEVWINNNGTLSSLPCPHWGITLQIMNQKQELTFETPQFIHLTNSWHYQDTINYLNNKFYNSFNSEENTIFKKDFIA